MCGITGMVHLEQDLRQQELLLRKMQRTLQRRGPDQEGIFLSPQCAMAHTRLAVIDVEKGRQPMEVTAGGETYTIVYNGELYNTAELRTQLEQEGTVFQTHCDTEVLLQSYVHWGPPLCGTVQRHFCLCRLGTRCPPTVSGTGPHRRKAAVLRGDPQRLRLWLRDQGTAPAPRCAPRDRQDRHCRTAAYGAGADCRRRRVPHHTGGEAGTLRLLHAGTAASPPLLGTARRRTYGELCRHRRPCAGTGDGCRPAADDLRCAHWNIPVRRTGFQPALLAGKSGHAGTGQGTPHLFRGLSGQRPLLSEKPLPAHQRSHLYPCYGTLSGLPAPLDGAGHTGSGGGTLCRRRCPRPPRHGRRGQFPAAVLSGDPAGSHSGSVR